MTLLSLAAGSVGLQRGDRFLYSSNRERESGNVAAFVGSSMKRCQNGFTLMELLVVIGIIALLAALMVPAFSSARDHARQTHCISNERQLSMAFSNYATDWDGTLPRWWTPDGGPATSTLGLRAGQRDWAVDTLPYVQNEKLYVCPSKPLLLRGYGINLWLATRDGFDVSAIKLPWKTAMFAEISGGHPPKSIYDFVDRSAPEGYLAPNDDSRFQFDPRHRDGAIIAFADGHVKWVPSNRYTRWPANAGKYLDLSDISPAAGGTPVGTYWWPTESSPPGRG
jgi:prepilin-type N-terminal cleavage/methylation domain-containing protein/prepilin-type processing-associated H-X9-DG protein